MERLVQIVLMRVMHRALTKMCGDQAGSVRDAQVICLICFFYSSTCCTPHSLERFTETRCRCLGLAECVYRVLVSGVEGNTLPFHYLFPETSRQKEENGVVYV